MYKEYFGLKENPFSIAPDPRYFYMSKGHSEALAHLVYGVNTDGGFILLTGEVGTGKTTVCRCLLEHLPENAEVAFILNPKLTVEELLATICDEFGISYPEGNKSNKVFVSAINDYLLNAHEEGKRAILILEEAQNLSIDVLEQIRLLTNLETNQRKLLQIVLLGQPELRRLLVHPQLRQLNQRITVRYHLAPLLKEEIPAYVNHRLSVAGHVRGQLFSKKPLSELYRLTGGIPRLINMICDRALIGAFVQGKDRVDNKTLLTATREVSGKNYHWWFRKGVFPAAAAVVLFFLFAAVSSLYHTQKPQAIPTPAATLNTVAIQEATVPPVPTLERPADLTGPGSRNAAYQALFSQWQIEMDIFKTPCGQATEKGLQCLNEKGSLHDLRQINKPAVLTLVDDNNNEYYATLFSLSGDTATFSIGGETKIVDIKEISSRWSGDYTLFWKPPHKYRNVLNQGSRGPLVKWLDEQLSIVHGRPVRPDNKQIFDNAMIKEIRQFQTMAGIVPDGVVGPRTLILLAAKTGVDGPTLNGDK